MRKRFFLFSFSIIFIIPLLVLAESSFVDIKNVNLLPRLLDLSLDSKTATITANVSGAYGISAVKAYIYRNNSLLSTIDLFDDGKHTDGEENDEKYGNSFDFSAFGLGNYQASVKATSRKGSHLISPKINFSVIETPKPTEKIEKIPTKEEIDRIEYEKKALKEAAEESEKMEEEIIEKLKKGEVGGGFQSFIKNISFIKKNPTQIISAKKYARKLLINGPSAEKLDILFVGDGFSENDLSNLISEVHDFSFNAYSPLKENISKINIWILPLEKIGVKLGDTLMNPMLEAVKEARKYNPQIDKIFLLSKKKFRSFAFFNGDAFVSQGSTFSTNELGSLIMHEFGHAFGDLADEYVEPALGDRPHEPNCLKTIPQKWIDARNTVHTSFGRDGLITKPIRSSDGCSYVISNSKPVLSSLMTFTGQNPYGPINEERLLERLLPYAPKTSLEIFHPEKDGYVFAGENLIIRWETIAQGVEEISVTHKETGKTERLFGPGPITSEKYFLWNVPLNMPLGKYELSISTIAPKISVNQTFNMIKNQALSGLCVSLDSDPIGDFFNVATGALLVKNHNLSYSGKNFLYMPPETSKDLYIVEENPDIPPYLDKATYLDDTTDNLYQNYHNLNGIKVANIITDSKTVFDTGKVLKITNFVSDCPDFILPFKLISPSENASFPLNSEQVIAWEDGDFQSHSYEILIEGKAAGGVIAELPPGEHSHSWIVKEYFNEETGKKENVQIGETYTLTIKRDDSQKVLVSIVIAEEKANAIISGLCSFAFDQSELFTQSGKALIEGKELIFRGASSFLKANSIINLYLLNYPLGTDNAILNGALINDSVLNTQYQKEGVKIATIDTGNIDPATDGGIITSLSQSPSCGSDKGSPNAPGGSNSKSDDLTSYEEDLQKRLKINLNDRL